MSYPRKIQFLVVEDDRSVRESYQEIISALGTRYDIGRPYIATSFEDAKRELESEHVYHVLILDLGLPWITREHAPEGVDPGQALITSAANRNQAPIPAILVISGRLNQADLPQIKERLDAGFWHGEFINKGMGEDDHIRVAVEQAVRYCDIGIHLADSGNNVYPSLSPREEDLLRRCILAQEGCCGVIAQWWSADRVSSYADAKPSDLWTKVLMGRFIMGNGYDLSRSTFLKFEPVDGALIVRQAANTMVQKLGHIKMCCAIDSGERSLLVTQQVGEAASPPIALTTLLTSGTNQPELDIPSVVADITDQLALLGSREDCEQPIKELLWSGHDLARLEVVLSRYKEHNQVANSGEVNDPIECYKQLANASGSVWSVQHTLTHGDLNATNIALEKRLDRFHAYIFDASGIRTACAVTDLATLEVTLLLHQTAEICSVLSALYPLLYNGEEGTAPTTPEAAKVYNFIVALRKKAEALVDVPLYALAVFDAALVQFGGLFWGTQYNKIGNPACAVELATYTSAWLQRVGGTLFV